MAYLEEVTPFYSGEVTKIVEAGNTLVSSDSVSSEIVSEPSLWESLLESYLADSKLLYHLEEVGDNFYALISTFTFGELAIFILLFVFYLTYLIFKFWSVFR